VVLFDALRIKIRDEGMVKNKAVYVALGINVEGIKEVLGLWVEQTEGAKFWMRVMTELKNWGVVDILIAVVDGLKGFQEAITSIYPEAQVQTCIVHMVRHSLKFVPWKERKEVADDPIYRAETVEAAQDRLADFEDKWGDKYPTTPSASPGGVTGRRSFPSWPIPQSCASSFIQPTPSRACTAVCARTSETGATFPTMMRPSSSSIW